MNEWGERLSDLRQMNDQQISGIVDSLLMEWMILHGLDNAVITDPLFDLIILRIQSMNRDYVVPTHDALTGRLLDTKFNECMDLCRKVKFISIFTRVV